MTYYESAADTLITKERVIQEMEHHGIPESDYIEYFEGHPENVLYLAQDVLSWLGY